jgi:hypothetical protein
MTNESDSEWIRRYYKQTWDMFITWEHLVSAMAGCVRLFNLINKISEVKK